MACWKPAGISFSRFRFQWFFFFFVAVVAASLLPPGLARRSMLGGFSVARRSSSAVVLGSSLLLRRTPVSRIATARSAASDATTGSMSAAPLVVVLAGPTAAGKSDVAARICASLGGIIVSADSVQAYQGVHIGANKPSADERKETPHLLVDVADHHDNYNAAEWKRDALAAIRSLLTLDRDPGLDDAAEAGEAAPRESVLREVGKARRTKGYGEKQPLVPVVCGGTMMYLQWLVHGQPDAMRPSDRAVAEAESIISGYQAKKDFDGALEIVGSQGKLFADRIKTFCGEDWYRLRRTLEVALTVRDEPNKEELIEKLYTGQRQGGLGSLGYDVRCFFLCPDDRMKHTRIIDQRCEQMVQRGLLKETADLTMSGSMPDMAARAIGYRQTLDYLQQDERDADGDGGDTEEEKFQGFLNNFSTATRRYAKKQMSWFRKDPDFLFVPVALDESKSERVEAAAKAIQDLCRLPRADYEKELQREDGDSALAKKKNEEQGKKMKFYQFERHILKPDTEPFRDAFAEAMECRQRMHAKRRKIES